MDSLRDWAEQNNMNTREFYGEKTEIVSIIAYLTGVRREIFANSVEPPLMETYDVFPPRLKHY